MNHAHPCMLRVDILKYLDEEQPKIAKRRRNAAQYGEDQGKLRAKAAALRDVRMFVLSLLGEEVGVPEQESDE